MKEIRATICHWNHRRNLNTVGILISCLLSAGGCANLSKGVAPLNPNQSVKLELKAKPGDVFETRYYSHSQVNNYFGPQLVKEKDEIVEFTIVETVNKVTANNHFLISTTAKDKDGIVDLNELAFPEVEEVIDFEYDAQAHVYRAGRYSPGSVFYVPPLPLPPSEVNVGDTWEMQADWRSAGNGIPLQVSLVAILKNLYPCGENKCAEIEISGDVAVEGTPLTEVEFVSEIWGRILFNVDQGVALWSEVRSWEDLRLPDNRTVVDSCIVSHLIVPAHLKWLPQKSNLNCEPKRKGTVSVPGTK